MSVKHLAKVIIYRMAEKGLEILLIKDEGDPNGNKWSLPNGFVEPDTIKEEYIPLDEMEAPHDTDPNAAAHRTFAFEKDEHDLPSFRSLLLNDVKYVKKRLKDYLIDYDEATYVSIKEAVKKVLPDEYEKLKELKDILSDRNSVKNI
ncbi:hypothetical protein KUV50_06455 [Membranicola marinus]|uniref:Nudix hydrolase domain-containing protein n=1 Tax=Membranihabitans marinus TaxID=1227546 RepID=A0A953L6K9_9BACT|nr:hypothetical protein [Membranihabitans marinus]MBY5957762.1 hypothetical protein [Membranihabitans marinus]